MFTLLWWMMREQNTAVPSTLLLNFLLKQTLNYVIMHTYLTEKEKLHHPYYRLMELRGEELKLKLISWSRLELIDWLSWNDHNGVYTDEGSLREFGITLTKERAIEIITEMISEP